MKVVPLPALVFRRGIVKSNASRTEIARTNACLGRADTRNVGLSPRGVPLRLSLLCLDLSDLALQRLVSPGLLRVPTLHACAKEPDARARDSTQQDHE